MNNNATPNLKEYNNKGNNKMFCKAHIYGDRSMLWWVMLYPTDESHAWPVSFNTKREAVAYMRERFQALV